MYIFFKHHAYQLKVTMLQLAYSYVYQKSNDREINGMKIKKQFYNYDV